MTKLKPLSPHQYRALDELAAAGGWDGYVGVTKMPTAHKSVVWASLERRGLVKRAAVSRSTLKWTAFQLTVDARPYLGADDTAEQREAAAEKAMQDLRELLGAPAASKTYRRARRALIASIRTAYPAVSARAVYELWRDFLAPVRECADLVRRDTSPSL